MADRSVKNMVSLNRLRVSRKRRPRLPSHITALDVDGQTLRIVQAVPRGNRAAVTRVAAAPLELSADADRSDPVVMGQAIARTLDQLRLKPGSVVMGIPRAQVVLRTLTLPVIEDIRDLASMVHFQVGRDLPFRMEDAIIDFKVRRRLNPSPPAEESGKSDPGTLDSKTEPAIPPKLEVLVAAVKREVADFYLKNVEAAGLQLAALGLLPYANARCVEACHVAEGEHAFALVSLRPDEVNIDVIAEQSLLFSRGATIKLHAETASLPATPQPTASPESATTENPDQAPPSPAAESSSAAPVSPAESPREETFTDIVTIEVVRTLHSYSGIEPHNPSAKIVVTGATGQEAAVVEALSNRLNIPCTLLDPAAALELPGDAREHASGAIAAIGLALGLGDPQGLPFDFLNPKRPAVQRDMRRIRVLAGIATAAAVLIFVMALRTYLITQHERIYRAVVAEKAEAEKKSPLYKKMIQQAATVDEWAKGGRNWLEHYAYLSAILPASEEVYITSLSVSGQGVIRLSVQARSGEILAKLDKQLRAAGYDVKPLAITPGVDRHGYEFRSNVELLVPDKLKLDLTKVKTPARPSDDASLDPTVNKGGGG